MYRILIADDEALEREGMRWIIERMLSVPFEIIEAENGKEALQKAQIFKPHIIFMDIRMPGIDGLTALKTISQQLPSSKMVLLTAYEYFDYAREAIKLGVKDYLIKPAKRTEITALIERLIEELDAELQQEQQKQSTTEQLNQLIPLVKTELALGFMSDNMLDEDIHHLVDSLQLHLQQVCSLVIALPHSYMQRKELYQIITSEADGMIAPYQYVASTIFNDHMSIFVMSQHENDTSALLAFMQQLAKQLTLTNKYTSSYTYSIFIGIGNPHHDIAGARRSYFEAVFASTSANETYPITLFKGIEQAGSQPLMQTANESYRYVQAAIEQIRQEREHQTFTMIDSAIQYIHQNYNRGELSLEEVAEHVHLNPYYFSKVFKQQTDATFIDYVTNYRIDQAKEWMLKKELSLKEICYLVGYNDPNYFSRVFKKVTGQTPSEYRSNNVLA